MRTIERFGQFKRDYKRVSKGRHRATFDAMLTPMITALGNDKPLALRYRDHTLIDDWKDHQDLHIRSDLVLIDRLPDTDTLQLVCLGSHSELGL